MQDDDDITISARAGRPEDEAFYRDAIGIFSRFIVLANAGGAVAVLSFIGAGGERLRSLGWLPALPVMLFVAGVTVAGFGLRANLKEAARRRKAGIAETHAPEKEMGYRKSAGSKGAEGADWFNAATWFFVLGAVTGLIFLIAYLT